MVKFVSSPAHFTSKTTEHIWTKFVSGWEKWSYIGRCILIRDKGWNWALYTIIGILSIIFLLILITFWMLVILSRTSTATKWNMTRLQILKPFGIWVFGLCPPSNILKAHGVLKTESVFVLRCKEWVFNAVVTFFSVSHSTEVKHEAESFTPIHRRFIQEIRLWLLRLQYILRNSLSES